MSDEQKLQFSSGRFKIKQFEVLLCNDLLQLIPVEHGAQTTPSFRAHASLGADADADAAPAGAVSGQQRPPSPQQPKQRRRPHLSLSVAAAV